MPNIITTPWRDLEELLEVRDQLYSNDYPQDALSPARMALNTIMIWRIHSPIPHVIDSTALFKEAQLLDASTPHASDLALRMTYCTALTRFVTGLLDAMQDGVYKKSMFDCATELGLPKALVILRHEATHEAMPGLEALRDAAVDCLSWLWSYYWRGVGEGKIDGGVYLEKLGPAVRELIEKWKGEGWGEEEGQSAGPKESKKRKRDTVTDTSPEEKQNSIETSAKETATVLGLLCQNQPDALAVAVEVLLEPKGIFDTSLEPTSPHDLLATALVDSQPLFSDIFLRHALGLLSKPDHPKAEELSVITLQFLDSLTPSRIRPDLFPLYHNVLGRCIMRPNKVTLSLACSIVLLDSPKGRKLYDRWADVLRPMLNTVGLDGLEERTESNGKSMEMEGKGSSEEDEDSEDESDEEQVGAERSQIQPGAIRRELVPANMTKKALRSAVKKIWE
ncbi:MAG: rRNA-processing protein las1 [Vezdaea aestivalis]|nr:MAG: rRNA-processing protein las1 [Vezdaea aestivalis]